ncbi:NAD(+) diphosphatase [Actinophytocola xinjiangensis]|uniref:NAD(+) diphosphatase n=1 Tax=Actinophytocola xinjiangensis TaxID=485602 RepID=UPI000AABEE48|nr:NAD(+) diphosphatase [Actinophytocola xinjiangensis]
MLTLPYNGLLLDRAGARRPDAAWVETVRAAPGSRVLAFWRDGCLVAGGVPVSAVVDDRDAVFLGLDGSAGSDAGVFAVDLSDLDEAAAVPRAGADAVVDVRRLFPTLGEAEAAVLAYARGMLHWHRNQRYCGACGARTSVRHAGHQLVCTGCGKLLFPRIEPAVIMLVVSPDGHRALLGRHRGAAADAYSTLAGFVEIGESLEGAVRRELAEEAGVAVSSVSYQASQAWPFPSGLMVGFRAVAVSEEVAVDQDELLEARWFTREELAELIDRHRAAGTDRRDSIETHLVQTWLAER